MLQKVSAKGLVVVDEINCFCNSWVVFNKDKYVEENFVDPEFRLYHECDSIKIWKKSNATMLAIYKKKHDQSSSTVL